MIDADCYTLINYCMFNKFDTYFEYFINAIHACM